MHLLELLVIGQFYDLDMRGLKAAVLDGAIYVTNKQDNLDDVFDDIVHEISHSIELTHGSILFADGELANEYLGKKKRFIQLIQDILNVSEPVLVVMVKQFILD